MKYGKNKMEIAWKVNTNEKFRGNNTGIIPDDGRFECFWGNGKEIKVVLEMFKEVMRKKERKTCDKETTSGQ